MALRNIADTLATAAKQDAQTTLLTSTRDNVATATARLEAIRDRLPAALSGSGGLKVTTTAPIALDAEALAAIAAGGGGGGGTVALDAPTLAALESITAAVTGTVAVSNFPATQPVSGPLTDTQLRATAVPISGALTDTQLRATALPVSGPLTDTQIRATALPVSAATLPLPTGAAADGTDATGVAAPTGGVGIRGWLSGIYNKLSGTLAVSAASLPLPSGAAQEHSTAASPGSVRLSDGASYIGTTAQRVHVSDGGVALSTSDSGLGTDGASAPAITGTGVRGWLRGIYEKVAGTLTVSGTVAVSSAPTTAVTGPLTDTQLRATSVPVSGPLTDTQIRATALPVSGPLTDTQIRATALPVSGPLTDTQLRATVVQVDVADEATREVGRSRLWDGTDEATVIPRGTAPTSSDKGLAVVELIAKRPKYQAVTTEITSGTAIATANLMTLWHPSALAKDVFILEIGVSFRVVQTAGTFGFELQFISAENGTPGGTVVTGQPLNNGDAASGMTIRSSPALPTVSGVTFQRAPFPLPAAATPLPSNAEFSIFKANSVDDGIELRSGIAEGLLIRQNIIATLTAAPIFTVYARYIERA